MRIVLSRLWLFVLVFGVVGCEVISTQSVVLQTDLGETVALSPSVGLFDRNDPDGIDKYCSQRIQELAVMPTGYERRRGPFKALASRYKPERYDDAVRSATCTLDYYYWPVKKEAFKTLNIEYRYNKAVWEQFYDAVDASVSARLKDTQWTVVEEKSESKYPPTLELTRDDKKDFVREYLDVYHTKDEEVVFELIVIDEKQV